MRKEKMDTIAETAITLFKQYGLRPVSMEDIASYNGISKKTLYENFESKEVMVQAIVQKIISANSAYIRLCPMISPNAVKEMENFAEHLQYVLEVLSPEFVRDLKKYYPEVYTRLIDYRDQTIIPYLESCLNRGITEDLFRPGMDKRNTGWLYCWQIQNVLEGDTSPEDVSRIIQSTNDLFLHGILNSKGLKMYGLEKQNENGMQKEKR